MIDWKYDDGGRADSGRRGPAGDCVTRAIAIATPARCLSTSDGFPCAAFETPGRRYDWIYRALFHRIKIEPTTGLILRRKSPKWGVPRRVYHPYLVERLGFTWTGIRKVGGSRETIPSCITMRVRPEDLPDHSPMILRLNKHLCAVIDGVVHDLSDPSRNGTRCVYGYYYLKVDTRNESSVD